MSKKKKSLIKYSVIMAAVILLCIITRKSWGDIYKELSRTPVEKIGVIIALSAGYFVLEGLVIKMLAVKYDPAFTWTQGTFCAYYCCFYKMITFGSGGGIAEIYYLNKRGIPAAKATGMDLVQYMLQRISIAVYGLLCVLVFFKQVKEPLEGYKIYLLTGSLMVIAVVSALIVAGTSNIVSGKLFHWAEKILGNKKEWLDKLESLRGQAAILQTESRDLLHEKKKLVVILGINQVKLTFWYAVPMAALSAEPGLTWQAVLALTALAFMLAGVIPAPAGMGSVEVIFLLLFTRITSSAKAVSAMLLLRFATNGIPFVVGGVCSLIIGKSSKAQ